MRRINKLSHLDLYGLLFYCLFNDTPFVMMDISKVRDRSFYFRNPGVKGFKMKAILFVSLKTVDDLRTPTQTWLAFYIGPLSV